MRLEWEFATHSNRVDFMFSHPEGYQIIRSGPFAERIGYIAYRMGTLRPGRKWNGDRDRSKDTHVGTISLGIRWNICRADDTSQEAKALRRQALAELKQLCEVDADTHLAPKDEKENGD